MPASYPRIPFVIGITGHRDTRSGDEADLRLRIRAALEWLIEGSAGKPGILNLAGWDGLRNTPVVILTSFAEGSERLILEVAQEYGADLLAQRHPGISIQATLPVEENLYLASPSFSSALSSDWVSQELTKVAKRSVVVMKGDLNPGTGPAPTHDQRCRAAVDYNGISSHLLLALWDDTAEPPDLTSDLVDAKLAGTLTPPLGSGDSFQWSEVGPVLHIRMLRKCNPAEVLTEPAVRLLHPNLIKFKEAARKAAAAVRADRLFCDQVARLEEFNREVPTPEEMEMEDAELKSLLGVKFGAELPADFKAILDRGVLKSVSTLAAIRRRAANLTRKYSGVTSQTLNALFGLTLLGALLLHLFGHWHLKDSHGVPIHLEGPEGSIQTLLGLGAIVCALAGLGTFATFKAEGNETRDNDYRSLAEGLRVQFYWLVSGLGAAVPDYYLLRQRNEVSWLRLAIQALATPQEDWIWRYERHRPGEEKRLSELTVLLPLLKESWVAGQAKYYDDAARENVRALHWWHRCGGILALGGLLTATSAIAWHGDLSTKLPREHLCCFYSLSAILVVLGLGFVHSARQPTKTFEDRGCDLVLNTLPLHQSGHSHEPPERARLDAMLWSGLKLLPSAFLLSAVAHLFCATLSVSAHFPRSDDLMVVAFGFQLVAGGLCVAWTEKNLFAEHAYQYNAMAGLFSVAAPRLEELITAFQVNPSAATLNPIHDLLRRLGAEALDENAEWLMLHRARPLEPVFGG